ncbi:MAG TPA: RNA polymerase sigma factor [Candidatus Saccharimonadales bacterium]|nr:RNA polymerase sigma factor [Candidatus Saccharimonadales bacterium]
MSKNQESKNPSRERVIHAIEASAAAYGLYKVAKYWVRHHQDAEDVAQNAYLKALRGADRFLGGSEVDTWLHRIAINASKDELAKRKHDPLTGLNEVDEDSVLCLEDEDGALDPVFSYLLSESNERVKELLAILPEDQKKAVGLELLGFNVEETSDMTGMPAGTVKAYRHRGRKTIGKKLEEEKGQ